MQQRHLLLSFLLISQLKKNNFFPSFSHRTGKTCSFSYPGKTCLFANPGKTCSFCSLFKPSWQMHKTNRPGKSCQFVCPGKSCFFFGLGDISPGETCQFLHPPPSPPFLSPNFRASSKKQVSPAQSTPLSRVGYSTTPLSIPIRDPAQTRWSFLQFELVLFFLTTT